MQPLIKHINQQLNTTVLSWTSLSGGDISSVYSLKTKDQDFVLKTNTQANASAMFRAEKLALESIATTRTIQTPTIFLCDQYQSTAYLLMEYVEAKRPEKQDFINLGQALAKLHQVTTDQFGWSENNFIGSLPQSNQLYNHWLDFYIEERLMPQFELAQKRQLLSKKEIPTAKILLQKGQHLFQNIQPALLHGDLWSGNYLIDKNGMPYLIDPAAYFGHAEVDLAMTRLFGGFGPAFYNAYYEVNPPQIGESRRRQWYQLYYLLVHLNLFGGQYYQSVVRTLQNL